MTSWSQLTRQQLYPYARAPLQILVMSTTKFNPIAEQHELLSIARNITSKTISSLPAQATVTKYNKGIV
jgi:hypothetical protein